MTVRYIRAVPEAPALDSELSTTEAIFDSTWLDPFVIQYQMPDTLPCVVAIDHANRDNRWEVSKTVVGTALDRGQPGKVKAIRNAEYRDSQQTPFAAWAPPLEHRPLLTFASQCLSDYTNQLPYSNDFPPFGVAEGYSILKYEPGQAYHAAHTDWGPFVNSLRHLTFVCFLNTVQKGGEFEFVQQSIFVRPVEGRAVIFPAGWTHAHRTKPAEGEDRYVFQLWWSFSTVGE